MCMLTRVQEECSDILIQVNVLANARSSTATYSKQLIILRLLVQHFFSKMSSFAVHHKR